MITHGIADDSRVRGIPMKYDKSVRAYMGYYVNNDDLGNWYTMVQMDEGPSATWYVRLATMPNPILHPEEEDLAWIATSQKDGGKVIYEESGFSSPGLAMIGLNQHLTEKGLQAIMEQENGQQNAADKLANTLAQSRRDPRTSQTTSRQQETHTKDIELPVNSVSAIEDAIQMLEEDKVEWEDAINKIQNLIDDADSTISKLNDMLTELSQ